jgi:hypothetical protein
MGQKNERIGVEKKHPKLEMHAWPNIITHLNKFSEIMYLKTILLLERG